MKNVFVHCCCILSHETRVVAEWRVVNWSLISAGQDLPRHPWLPHEWTNGGERPRHSISELIFTSTIPQIIFLFLEFCKNKMSSVINRFPRSRFLQFQSASSLLRGQSGCRPVDETLSLFSDLHSLTVQALNELENVVDPWWVGRNLWVSAIWRAIRYSKSYTPFWPSIAREDGTNSLLRLPS